MTIGVYDRLHEFHSNIRQALQSLEITWTFSNFLDNAIFPVALIPASCTNSTEAEDQERADILAVTARIEGLGVVVLAGRMAGAQEFFVLATGDESQVVDFARKAADWFLLRLADTDDLLRENADRSREKCIIRETGFVLPDGRTFEFAKAYRPDHVNRQERR